LTARGTGGCRESRWRDRDRRAWAAGAGCCAADAAGPWAGDGPGERPIVRVAPGLRVPSAQLLKAKRVLRVKGKITKAATDKVTIHVRLRRSGRSKTTVLVTRAAVLKAGAFIADVPVPSRSWLRVAASYARSASVLPGRAEALEHR
jgi:hypothetical protein